MRGSNRNSGLPTAVPVAVEPQPVLTPEMGLFAPPGHQVGPVGGPPAIPPCARPSPGLKAVTAPNGIPDWLLMMPLICHPPINLPIAPFL